MQLYSPFKGPTGHPITPVLTLLRQVEAPVKIYNFRWVPTLIYSVKWSIMAGQWSTMTKMTKHIIFLKIFISIQGVQGAIREGPEPIPEVKNIRNFNFSKNYILGGGGIPPCGILNSAFFYFAGPLFFFRCEIIF